jgi:hypothetical protein
MGGTFIVTTMRFIWFSKETPKMNLSVGHDTIILNDL